MRRASTSILVALALLFAAGLSPAVAVTPPANDDLANAASVSSLFFEAAPDMSGATLEPGETACDESGGLMDQSVWYAFDMALGATVTIEINGIETGVTAAVYGPFEAAPTAVIELPDATYCIYGTGMYQGLTEWYEPGTYLVQLTTVSVWDVEPTIRIEQQPIQVYPFGSYALDVRAGASLFIDWGWFACSRGLANIAATSFDQEYVLWRVDTEPATILEISRVDAHGYWGPLYRDDSMVETCVVGPGRGWGVRWTYWLPMLEPGTYELSTGIYLRHTITDGADSLDGNGRPDLYRRGWITQDLITINVVAVD